MLGLSARRDGRVVSSVCLPGMDSSVGAGSSGYLVLNILAVDGVDSLARLDGLGAGLDDGDLVADLVNLVLALGGVQDGSNGMVHIGKNSMVAKELGISLGLGFSLTLHLLNSRVISSSSLDKLRFADLGSDINAVFLELDCLDWHLNVVTLVVDLGCTGLEGDCLIDCGTVGSMVDQRSYGMVTVTKGFSFGLSLTLDNGGLSQNQGR